MKKVVLKTYNITKKYGEQLAVDNVNMTIKKGDIYGFIGQNGAGKTTLIRLITGLIHKSSGDIELLGVSGENELNKARTMVGSLIESPSFYTNMTARENVFLNGTVLGHSRKFMEEHFDEIIEFAELWDFLDVPIKNFSSGMQARLGFAIATMVRPDILVVDEILSVGDYQFQEKCYKRMEDMLSGGTTLLYVSHDVKSVRKLCDHAIWIDKGVVRKSGLVEEVTNEYMNE